MAMTLKALRVNKGLTAEEASALIGVSSVTLSSWENGKTFPSVSFLPRILNLYSVKYDDINFFADELSKSEFEKFANEE